MALLHIDALDVAAAEAHIPFSVLILLDHFLADAAAPVALADYAGRSLRVLRESGHQ
jgi:hypothetical protein